ncbi:MAG: NAD-dependent malic enzyme [Rhodothermales bacterium]
MRSDSSVVDDRVQHGVRLLHDPLRNKGTAFTAEERDALGLRGLLPPAVQSMETQVLRVMGNLARKDSDLERYIFLAGLQDRNETLFYRVVMEHLPEMMPLIYTPTVGAACQHFGQIFRRPRGLFVTADDFGHVRSVLRNWPHRDVRIIVVTDGERILGLGDLGANGMGIAVGKLALYTACAGIHPSQCLPVTIDVGTENENLRKDPLYVGTRRSRLRGEDYDALVDEFLAATREVFPRAVVQLEDFANINAFRLLRKYNEQYSLFDDDIQGTGSVVLAGLLAAMRVTGNSLSDNRFLFLGAGEAGIGIADLIVASLVSDGMDAEEARRRCFFVDSTGLVVNSRENLAEHKRPFAHDMEFVSTLEEAAEVIRPTAVIGVSGVPGSFTEKLLREMAEHHPHPIVFALSNPTAKSECTASQAYEWTGGRAIFASGSPFPPVDYQGKTFVPGQANNAYIFPGVGLGAIVSNSNRVTDEMFFIAARELASMVSEHDLGLGRLFPSLSRIREVSARIAVSVAAHAFERGYAQAAEPDDLVQTVQDFMFVPEYASFA